MPALDFFQETSGILACRCSAISVVTSVQRNRSRVASMAVMSGYVEACAVPVERVRAHYVAMLEAAIGWAAVSGKGDCRARK